MKLFVSPHNDDEALFGAFTLLREKPVVVIVFDSYVQANRGTGITAQQRREETIAACEILGCEARFLCYRDDEEASALRIGNALLDLEPTEIWAPAFELGGHDQHNFVACACNGLPNLTRYLTYTRTKGKSRSENEVPISEGEWIGRKLKALSCYGSQHAIDSRVGCWPHFLRDQTEYYA